MFDSCYDVVQCPHCEETLNLEFQTKLLSNCCKSFQKEDRVTINDLILIEAYIMDGLAVCPACGRHIKGTIWIADGKFVGVKDVKLWEMRS